MTIQFHGFFYLEIVAVQSAISPLRTRYQSIIITCTPRVECCVLQSHFGLKTRMDAELYVVVCVCRYELRIATSAKERTLAAEARFLWKKSLPSAVDQWVWIREGS